MMEPFQTNQTSDDPLGTVACDVPEVPTPTAPEPDASSAAQSSRRAQNARHRATVAEPALEIHSHLFNEIRRLMAELEERDTAIQGLVAERNKAIQDSKEARDALVEGQKTIQALLAERDKAIQDSKEVRGALVEYKKTIQDLLAERNKAIQDSKEARNALVERDKMIQALRAERDKAIQDSIEAHDALMLTRDHLAATHRAAHELTRQSASTPSHFGIIFQSARALYLFAFLVTSGILLTITITATLLRNATTYMVPNWA